MTRVLLALRWAPTGFFVLLLVQGFLRPGYDWVNHFGSELSNGPWGWVQVANFVVTGTLTVGFAVGLRRALGGVVAPVCTGLFGAGLVVAGVFTTDPKPGYLGGDVGDPSVPSLVHDANLFPTWAAMSLAILALAWRFARRREWGWATYALGSAVGTWAVLLVAVARYDAETQTGSWHGVWQRVSMGVGFVFFGVVGGRLARSGVGGG